MSDRENPKFCVGEEVMIRGQYSSDHDIDKTEVICLNFHNKGDGIRHPEYCGWTYQTRHQPDMTLWWHEGSLKKLPPEQRTSWEDCAWQPADQLCHTEAHNQLTQ